MTTRLTNALVGNKLQNVNHGELANTTDLTLGAMGGHLPNFQEFIAQTGYTPRNIRALLLEEPRGYTHLPDRVNRTRVLKSLIEVQANQITGLVRGLTVESSERQISQAGHMFADRTRVTQAQPNVNYTFTERHNAGISKFIMSDIRLLHGDPLTQRPGIFDIVPAGSITTEVLADFATSTVLFYEPDVTGTKVVWAWLAANFFFETSTELESQFDISASLDVPTLSVSTKAFYDQEEGTQRMAQALLTRLIVPSYLNGGPNSRPAFVNGVNAALTAAERGYIEDIKKEAARAGGSVAAGSGTQFNPGGGTPTSTPQS